MLGRMRLGACGSSMTTLVTGGVLSRGESNFNICIIPIQNRIFSPVTVAFRFKIGVGPRKFIPMAFGVTKVLNWDSALAPPDAVLKSHDILLRRYWLLQSTHSRLARLGLSVEYS